ncbi:hypothetical protein B0H10DRAFT_2017320 [Mycena sp. CBHHK59/15]|nr:hypothetical protein B0H10DRAFT_2017320 [Mycena sp. CBHHK59/15]
MSQNAAVPLSVQNSRHESSHQSLGSLVNDQVIARLLCSNREGESSPGSSGCQRPAKVTCSGCHLVKYCGKECQKQDWQSHKKDCKSPYLKTSWRPAWEVEDRFPSFYNKTDDEPAHTFFGKFGNYLWGNIPAINCLQIARNERERAASMDLKLCFAASGDLRNVIVTANDLPDNYQGRCEILCNDLNGIVVNRNLVILFVLLTAGSAPEEAAELATHLMYSSALTPSMSNHVQRCIDIIYGSHGTMTASWDTRGPGKLRSFQRLPDVQPALQMFRSKYELSTALKSMADIMWNPGRVDYRDRYLAALQPHHRLSFYRFRTTGVLAPFSVNVDHFTQPNRLLFSPEGQWLSLDNANPLFGWELGPACESGIRHGATIGDIYGCLFFHVKEQFQKFASRAKDFKLDITLSQTDARILCKIIPTGMMPAFHKVGFDRIETSNMADLVGADQVIRDWGPLLNKGNSHSVLLINFMNWVIKQPDSSASHSKTNLNNKLLEQAASILGFDLLRALPRGVKSHELSLILKCVDAFYDNERSFSEFLRKMDVGKAAESAGVRLRPIHRIHPKRFGLSLDKPQQKIPNLTRNDFYNLFLLGGTNFTDRFVEIEAL